LSDQLLIPSLTQTDFDFQALNCVIFIFQGIFTLFQFFIFLLDCIHHFLSALQQQKTKLTLRLFEKDPTIYVC